MKAVRPASSGNLLDKFASEDLVKHTWVMPDGVDIVVFANQATDEKCTGTECGDYYLMLRDIMYYAASQVDWDALAPFPPPPTPGGSCP